MTPLKIDIAVTPTGASWQVTATIDKVLIATAPMPGGGGVFPLVGNGPAPAELEAALAAIRARQCTATDAELVGKHLFDALLGALWTALVARIDAGTERVELGLAFHNDDPVAQLPWELMHGPAGYLARGIDRSPTAITEIAITRRCARKAVPYRALSYPLRYLFVVGTREQDKIRAGAECLGLLRQVGEQIQDRILLHPSLSELEKIVEEFAPDVVHVISHGDYQPGRGAALRLYDDVSKTELLVEAEELAERLVRGNSTPAIVLLSACASGASLAGTPLGIETCEALGTGLVRAGVPIVVAMAGEIDDMACRLFARAFGVALARSQPPVWAATIGRRAALRSRALPKEAVDWAMIDVFIGDDIPSDLGVTLASHTPQVALIENWLKRSDVDLLATSGDQRIAAPFCGRAEIIEQFYRVLAGVRPALCITAKAPPSNDLLRQLGKRRTLKELGAIATRAGHIPVPVLPHKRAQRPDDAYPRCEQELFIRLARAIKKTRAVYGLKPRESEIVTSKSTELDDVAAALEIELVALRDDARETHTYIRERKGNVVVLLNDIHAYGPATPYLLHQLVTTFGLGATAAAFTPVVMTFQFGGAHDGSFTDATEGDKARTCFGTPMELKPFETGEDMLAYQRVLLQPYRENPDEARKRWFLELRRPKLVLKVQKFFHRGTQGYPGKLWSDGFAVAVEAAKPDDSGPGILCEASDDDLLAVLKGIT